MKKYVLYQTYGGDVWDEYFDSLEDALKKAEFNWDHLTTKERASIEFWVGSCELDEDGMVIDGNYDVIKSYT